MFKFTYLLSSFSQIFYRKILSNLWHSYNIEISLSERNLIFAITSIHASITRITQHKTYYTSVFNSFLIRIVDNSVPFLMVTLLKYYIKVMLNLVWTCFFTLNTRVIFQMFSWLPNRQYESALSVTMVNNWIFYISRYCVFFKLRTYTIAVEWWLFRWTWNRKKKLNIEIHVHSKPIAMKNCW